MFSVTNICGELQTGSRAIVDLPPVSFNTSDGKFYEWSAQMVDGELTGYWKEITAPTGIYGYVNVSGVWYQWQPTVVDGELTGAWVEVSGTTKTLNCMNGQYYNWAMTTVDGELTGYWKEAT